MQLTSQQVRDVRFSGTRHVYDRREVDAFVSAVQETIAKFERDLVMSRRRMDSLENALQVARSELGARDGTGSELDELRRQAEDVKVEALAEAARIVRRAETDAAILAAGAAPNLAQESDPVETRDAATAATGVSGDIQKWVAVLEAEHSARDVLDEAEEEARRSLAQAREQAADAERELEEALAQRREEHEQSLRRDREVAEQDAEQLLGDAAVESGRIVDNARTQAAEMTATAEREADGLERRIRQIRSALRDLETRFEKAASSTRAEFAMLGDLVDLEAEGVVDLRDDPGSAESPPSATAGADEPAGSDDDEAGFYKRRMAGLRNRIEALDDEEKRL